MPKLKRSNIDRNYTASHQTGSAVFNGFEAGLGFHFVRALGVTDLPQGSLLDKSLRVSLAGLVLSSTTTGEGALLDTVRLWQDACLKNDGKFVDPDPFFLPLTPYYTSMGEAYASIEKARKGILRDYRPSINSRREDAGDLFVQSRIFYLLYPSDEGALNYATEMREVGKMSFGEFILQVASALERRCEQAASTKKHHLRELIFLLHTFKVCCLLPSCIDSEGFIFEDGGSKKPLLNFRSDHILLNNLLNSLDFS